MIIEDPAVHTPTIHQFTVTLSIQQKCGIGNLDWMNERVHRFFKYFKWLDMQAFIPPVHQYNAISHFPIKTTSDSYFLQNYMIRRHYFKCTNEWLLRAPPSNRPFMKQPGDLWETPNSDLCQTAKHDIQWNMSDAQGYPHCRCKSCLPRKGHGSCEVYSSDTAVKERF